MTAKTAAKEDGRTNEELHNRHWDGTNRIDARKKGEFLFLGFFYFLLSSSKSLCPSSGIRLLALRMATSKVM
ncbi:Uncharacterized protein APZ42_005317 [Daphnia magna]|uniref:Uncharacterized protein n=1 Tax=Daphnia magna TaxID=35525 RepID=A0A162D595_9CRUS|nr:Uncharacterized protein APZ42_005317 [Daphnia magna]